MSASEDPETSADEALSVDTGVVDAAWSGYDVARSARVSGCG